MNCISISYKNTPLQVRQCCAFSKEEKKQFEKAALLKKATGCIVVSTCNRVEIYFTGNEESIDKIKEQFLNAKHMGEDFFKKNVCIYSGEGTLYHLFKVTCGMDSMVLGEDEILRQVKEAYLLSKKWNHCDYECNLAFQQAFHVAKEIKTGTKLSKTPISIGTLAAHAVFDFLSDRQAGTVLLVGASGKIGGIVGKNLAGKEKLHILVTSRSHNKELEFLEKAENMEVVSYENRYGFLDRADVIISATSSPHFTFTKKEVSEAFTEKKKRLFIDLAVPCDVDKEIGSLLETTIINIDEFQKLSKENNKVKLKEMEKAEIYMEEGMEELKKAVSYHRLQKNMDKLENIAEIKGVSYLLYQLRDRLSGDEIQALVRGLYEITGGQ